MNPVPASLLAMIAGWGIAILSYMLWGQVTRGYVTDLVFMAMWPAIFAFIGWVTVVIPVVLRFGDHRLLVNWRWAWLGWLMLGTGTYLILVTWWLRWPAVMLAWYPALMGLVAGEVFALLRRFGREGDQ